MTVSVWCLLMLMYFCQQRRSGCTVNTCIREASYRFNDSLCILNPTTEKKKKNINRKRREEKKSALCCFIHHSFQNIQTSPSTAGKSNKDNAGAVYPCPHAAPQDCTPTWWFVYESGAASRGAAPRDPLHRQGQPPPPRHSNPSHSSIKISLPNSAHAPRAWSVPTPQHSARSSWLQA